MNTHLLSNSIALLKAALARKDNHVKIPYSSYLLQVFNVLYYQGCIRGISVSSNNSKTSSNLNITVYLKYKHRMPVITKVNVISKPSKRIFWTKKNILEKALDSKSGFYLISTSKGLLTSNELAVFKSLNLESGGEVILKVEF